MGFAKSNYHHKDISSLESGWLICKEGGSIVCLSKGKIQFSRISNIVVTVGITHASKERIS